MSLTDVHGQLSSAVMLYAIALGVWGVFNYIQRHNISAGYWGALVIGELSFMTQGLLGGLLWSQGHRPMQELHVIYGATTALGIPLIYAYTRGREGRTESLAYGSAALIVALLILQATVTA